MIAFDVSLQTGSRLLVTAGDGTPRGDAVQVTYEAYVGATSPAAAIASARADAERRLGVPDEAWIYVSARPA